MQLCECCTQFDRCQLSKRKDHSPFAPCDYFHRIAGISQERYEALKKQILLLQGKVKAPSKQQTVVDVDIPFEITTFPYPYPLAWMVFLNVDLSDNQQRDQFIAQYLTPHFYLKGVPNLEGVLKQGQKDLRAFVDMLDLDKINNYLAGVVPQLRVDTTGLRCVALFRGPLPTSAYEGQGAIAVFFLQVAERLLKRQPIKRCPVCGEHFALSQRGPRGRTTCGKDRCRKAMSRNPKKYMKSG